MRLSSLGSVLSSNKRERTVSIRHTTHRVAGVLESVGKGEIERLFQRVRMSAQPGRRVA
jgi:hypothetical protein